MAVVRLTRRVWHEVSTYCKTRDITVTSEVGQWHLTGECRSLLVLNEGVGYTLWVHELSCDGKHFPSLVTCGSTTGVVTSRWLLY